MIDSQIRQQRCVEIVDRDHVFDRFVTEVVGGSVCVTFTETAAGQPERKRSTIMIAARCGRSPDPRTGGPTEVSS